MTTVQYVKHLALKCAHLLENFPYDPSKPLASHHNCVTQSCDDKEPFGKVLREHDNGFCGLVACLVRAREVFLEAA